MTGLSVSQSEMSKWTEVVQMDRYQTWRRVLYIIGLGEDTNKIIDKKKRICDETEP